MARPKKVEEPKVEEVKREETKTTPQGEQFDPSLPESKQRHLR